MNHILRKSLLFAMFAACIATVSLAQPQKKKNTSKRAGPKVEVVVNDVAVKDPWKLLNSTEKLVEITTDYGVMIAKLYDSTPLHRDNFIKLINERFFDSLLFHRVIDGFMIQGGDPQSKNAADGAMLGNGSAPGERIPAEFKPALFHKKGALAAARDGNPEKASSNCQFYIVQGKTLTDQDLEGKFKGNNYSASQKEIYKRIGGVPFLDQNYTVFGEVISGLDVVDKIAKTPKDSNDRPLTNARMRMKLLN